MSAKEAGRRIVAGAGRASQSGKAHKRVIYPALIVLVAVIALVVTLTTGAFALDTGAKDPTVAVDNSGVGTVPWDTPEQVTSPGDSIYATLSLPSGTSTASHYLWATGYGFSLPSNAQILGLQLSINRSTNSSSSGARDNALYLVYNGSTLGSNAGRTTTNWPNGSLGSYTYGSASDLSLWGGPL